MENSPHWRAPNLTLSSPIPPQNPGETFPELQLYRNPRSFEKRLLRGDSRGLDPDTGTRDLSGLHCASPSSSDPETLLSSLLTLPASSSGSRNQESGKIRAGLGSRGARGEAGSPPAPGASFTSRIPGSSECPGQLTGSPIHLCTQKEPWSQCTCRPHLFTPARFFTLLHAHTLLCLLTSPSTSSRTGSFPSPASLGSF